MAGEGRGLDDERGAVVGNGVGKQAHDGPALDHHSEGEETLPGRLAGGETRQEFPPFTQAWRDELLTEKSDCVRCEFLRNCQGYFKWPHREYSCDGVQEVMRRLQEAAEELRRETALLYSRVEREPA